MANKMIVGKFFDDKRYVTKSLIPSHSYDDVQIFDECSMIDPVFILTRSEYNPKFDNYLFFEKWNRYYYVTDVIFDGNRIYLHCHEDVLNTFSKSIRQLKALVKRQEKKYDPLLVDNEVMANCQRNIHYKSFPQLPFATNGAGKPIVLTVSGGNN